MYCPRCAAQNLDDARFCRACGADISLVPQALTGQFMREAYAPLESADQQRGGSRKRRGKKEKDPASIEGAIKNIFIGVAFILMFVAGLLFFRHAFPIWFWSIIPGLACMGEGVGQYLRFKHEQRSLHPAAFQQPSAAMPPPARASVLPPHNTSEIVAPPASVTEGTTRHLGVPKGGAN